jgi:hypothetical protein
MPYGPWDEHFVHQLPRPLDEVSDSEPSWSDRCYFNVGSPDGSMLVTTGYGNNPNTQSAHGYIKVALGDGRHWDIDATRKVTTDRGDLYAGPMRWTCVEPLERWTLEIGPNGSGIEYELHHESRAPMWELLPITIRKRGRTIVDMFHIKQPARYTGWVSIDGERVSVDGFHGGREVLWDSMGLFTSHPAALTRDEFVARWSERTGIRPEHRDWYRALAGFKLAVILFVGGKLYDAGHTQDDRLHYMGMGVPIFAGPAAVELGLDAS